MKRICPVSQQEFEIDQQDLDFYAKIGVLPPTLSPPERLRRRLAFRPKDFHLRKCDKTGKLCMSCYSPKLDDITTYSHDAFWSDEFEALSYGHDFDFSRPFFEQFNELYRKVPKLINASIQNENCQYLIYSSRNRDCYLVDETDESRECFYGYDIQRCTNVVDAVGVHDCELLYDVVGGENCYNVFCSQNVFHCSESAFLMNCRGCKNCLFSANLRNKENYIFNKPASADEVQKLWAEIFTGKRADLQAARGKFSDFLKTQLFPCGTLVNTEDSTGNYLFNCKNVTDSFWVDGSRDCRYCTNIHKSQDCYDTHIYEGELIYECCNVGPEAYNNLFSHSIWYSKDVAYCGDAFYLQNCFGCVGLKKKEYCIFNKQHSRDDYVALRHRIIDHMKETGEWGEFFPIELSLQPYNQSMAQRFFPLDRNTVEGRGLKWIELDDIQGTSEAEVPEDIGSTPPNLLESVFTCSSSGKKFRFVAPEVKFLQQWKIPLPTQAPNERVELLWRKMGGFKLHTRSCSNCQHSIASCFGPQFDGRVLCDSCYIEAL